MASGFTLDDFVSIWTLNGTVPGWASAVVVAAAVGIAFALAKRKSQD